MLLMMNALMKSEVRLEEKSTCTPPQRWTRRKLQRDCVRDCIVVRVFVFCGEGFVRVLARRLEWFAEDMILTEAQGGLGVVGDVWIGGWCGEVYVKGGRGRTRIHIWPSTILIRLVIVCGKSDCGIR